MTRDEFIKKAKELNYSDDQIKDIEQLREDMQKDTGYLMPYDKILLIEQPVY